MGLLPVNTQRQRTGKSSESVAMYFVNVMATRYFLHGVLSYDTLKLQNVIFLLILQNVSLL